MVKCAAGSTQALTHSLISELAGPVCECGPETLLRTPPVKIFRAATHQTRGIYSIPDTEAEEQMSYQHLFPWDGAAKRTLALGLFALLPAFHPNANAADDLSCTSGDGCTSECAEEPLTGPLGRPIYTPSDPITEDVVTPFIQQPTQPAMPSVFSEGVEGTLTAQGHAPGYIDWAMPRTQFRLRFDSGFNNNRPDRAEFFYAQCGCGGGPGPGVGGPAPTVNGSVDYQDVRGYLEIASGSRFSVFGELPVRFLQTSPASGLGGVQDTGDAEGISDVEAGFKYALSQDADHVFTFQLKTYIPTGDASRGLGTDHVSIEPGFLAQRRVNSRLDIFGELRDWIPVNGSTFGGQNFAGNVLRYGVGAAYSVVDTSDVRISPIVEFVGWSVLDGLMLNTDRQIGAENVDAATTIVNAKAGLRTLFKDNGSTLYVGYGHALTGQRWYEDIVRVEYTIFL